MKTKTIRALREARGLIVTCFSKDGYTLFALIVYHWFEDGS